MPANSVQLPPQAIEAEMAVLGSCLLEKDAVEKAVDILAEKDFYQDSHREKKSVTGVASGLSQFDSLTTGFQKSDLILIAARPSQGKTALSLNIAANVVLDPKNPHPVLYFSMEMSRHAIMQRLISSE